jgi:hypothetical protein
MCSIPSRDRQPFDRLVRWRMVPKFRFNGIAGPNALPVLRREVVEGQHLITVLLQTDCRDLAAHDAPCWGVDRTGVLYRLSGDAADPCVSGQCPLPSRQARQGMAGVAGKANKAPLCPGLLSASEPYRTTVGADAQKRHSQQKLRHVQRFLHRYARLLEGSRSQILEQPMRRCIR